MAECPNLNTLSSDLDAVTTENESQLRLSTYTTTVGINVKLSCLEGYKLVGQQQVTCRIGGTWDFSTKPYCEKEDSDGLSDSMKILIGALVGGILLFIAIVILIACLIRRKKKKLSEEEKFYRQLQEEDIPRGHKPGEMVNETQYRPPSYATAWPALSHIGFVGKKEYPFRPPEGETDRNTMHAGMSIWDNNDYFFGKPDVGSNQTETAVSESRRSRRLSADNIVQQQPDEIRDNNFILRKRSLSGDAYNVASRDPAPIFSTETYQNDTSYRLNDNYIEDRQLLTRPEGSDKYIYAAPARRKQQWPKDNQQEINGDVVVEVRIPSRYLKPKPSEEVREIAPVHNRYRPETNARRSPSVQTEQSDKSKSKEVYQGNWPMRHDIKSLNEFNKRALLHNRDPFLWRPVDTNFGFDAWHDAKF